MSLSIHGLGPGAYGPTPSDDRARSAPARGSERHPADPASRHTDPSSKAGEATGGVDARLWELLSADERAFYLRSAASGPLTYAPTSPARGSVPPGRQVGGRIDVRV
ncbi:MAG: hypothetical protein ABL963_09055 [Longimicrobiales bacterium]